MPKVYVDASIFTKAKAFGKISGHVDLEIVPQVGDLMTFWAARPRIRFRRRRTLARKEQARPRE